MSTFEILHIEDKPGDQFLIKEYAESFEGIRVNLEQTSTLNDALGLLHQRNFDLIILDLGLPNGNGIQNLVALFKVDPELNVLVLTADGRNAIAHKAIKLGANDYLIKNECNAHILEKSILFCIERYRLKRDKKEIAKALNYKLAKLKRRGTEKGMYVLRIDLEGRYTFYNKRFQDTFLRGSDLNFIGKASLDHILKEDHPKTFKTVENALQNPGVPQGVELRKPGYLPGTILHTFWEFTALLDHYGQPFEILCTGYDIADVVLQVEGRELQDELNKIIIENSSDLILSLNEDAEVLSVSPSVTELFGYPAEEVIGQSIFHSIYPEDCAVLKEFLENSLNTGTDFKVQFRFKHKSGKFLWLQAHVDKFESLRQNSIFILVARLIEDEKELLAELTTSKEEYQALYKASPGSILITDYDTGRIIDFNKEFENLFGFSSDDIIGKTTVEIGLWESKKIREKTIQNYLNSKSKANLQIELYDSKSNSIPCLIQLGLFEQNESKRLVAVILDNRELFNQNLKLKDAEQKLNSAQELAKVGSWSFDYQNMNFYWSHGMTRIFGFSKLNSQPKSIFDYLSNVVEEDRKEFIRKYRSALESGRRFKQVIRLKVKDKLKYIELAVLPKRKGEEVKFIEGVCRDITSIHLARINEKQQSIFFKKLANISLKFVAADKEAQIHTLFTRFITNWLGDDLYLLTSSRTFSQGKTFFKVETVHNPYGNIFEDNRKAGLEYPVDQALEKKLKSLDGNFVEYDVSQFNTLGLMNPKELKRLEEEFPNAKFYIYRLFYDDKIQGICFLSFPNGSPNQFNKEFYVALGNQMNNAIKAVRSRELLRQNSVVLNNALAGALAGVWRCDLEQEIIYGDSHYASLVASNDVHPQINLKELVKRIDPEHLQKTTESFENHLNGHSNVYHAEMRYKCFDGKYRWFEDKGRITKRDSKGQPLEMIGIRINIDKRKKREEQLFLFETVLKNARDGILITDNQKQEDGGLRILYANKAIEKITGFSQEELIGKSPEILQGPDTQLEKRAEIAKAISKGEPIQIELLNYTKSGQEYLSHLNIQPVKNDKSQVTHFISLQRDITHEKEKDEEYYDLTTRLELALNANEIGVWDYDLKNSILIWDDNMHSIYEKPKTEFENKVEDWSNSIHEDDKDYANGKLLEAIEDGSDILSMRFRIRTNRGVKSISTRAKIIRDSNGQAQRMIGLNWDITQLASYETELALALNERENILSSVNEGFITISEKLRLTYINEAATRILSVDSDVNPNLISIQQVFPYVSHKGLYEAINRCAQAEVSENLITYHGNSDRWVDISIYPQEKGISMFIQDITELRKRQTELERLKQNTEALINTTQDHMWSVNKDLEILSANNNYLNYLSQLAQRAVKIGDSVLVDSVRKQRFKGWVKLYQKALEGKEIEKLIEEEIDGKEVIFSLHFYPIFDNRHKVSGVACYSYDATERLNYLRMIERQNKSLQEIAWMQSHVLRAPLARIMGLVNLIDLEDVSINEQTHVYLEHIMDSAQEMDDVVRDITKKTKDFEINNPEA